MIFSLFPHISAVSFSQFVMTWLRVFCELERRFEPGRLNCSLGISAMDAFLLSFKSSNTHWNIVHTVSVSGLLSGSVPSLTPFSLWPAAWMSVSWNGHQQSRFSLLSRSSQFPVPGPTSRDPSRSPNPEQFINNRLKLMAMR